MTHRRHTIVAIFGLLCPWLARAQSEPNATVWIRIYVDRFEFQGKAYRSGSELSAALRRADPNLSMALNWIIPKGADEQARMNAQVRAARAAVADAGLKALPAVANEIF